jgi:hypothetical protein
MHKAFSFFQACRKVRSATISAPTTNSVRDERVKPALLNPIVAHVQASGDLPWVLLCVAMVMAVWLIALTLGKAP